MNKHIAKIRTVLVTGAGGFLGSYLIEALIQENLFQIMAFDLDKATLTKRFDQAEQLGFYDIADFENKNIPFDQVDIVIHCAFSRSFEGFALAKSLEFTKQILGTAAEYEISSFINISSRSVYGQNPNTPWSEVTPVNPDSLYAMAKFSSELLVQTLAKAESNFFYTNLRLAGLVGPELDVRIVNRFVQQALKGETIKIKGGNQQFAYLDVRDAASGIAALLQKKSKTWKSVFNLGYYRSYSIIEIAEVVANVARKFNYPEVKINIEKTDEMLYADIDSSLFYTNTNWKPKYDMEAIVASIFEKQLKPKKYKCKQ